MTHEIEKHISKEFESRLEGLRKQILAASIHFSICIDLWPTKERVNVINRYRGYFIPARSAHFNQFAIIIHEIFSTRENAPSFYNVFKMIRINPDLVPDLDLRLLGTKLRQYNKTRDAIMEYRNNTAAHSFVLLDTEDKTIVAQDKPKRKPIFFGEARKLIETIQEIFNKICSSYSPHKLWSFEPLEHNHTKYILDELEAYYRIDK